jgi:hypothetical protein
MNDNESGPLDLGPIEKRLKAAIPGPYFGVIGWDDGLNVYVKDGNDGHIANDLQAEIFTHAWKDISDLLVEVKRLRGNIGLLIQKWSFHSPHTRDTLKAKDVLAALQDALVSENYYAGGED